MVRGGRVSGGIIQSQCEIPKPSAGPGGYSALPPLVSPLAPTRSAGRGGRGGFRETLAVDLSVSASSPQPLSSTFAEEREFGAVSRCAPPARSAGKVLYSPLS